MLLDSRSQQKRLFYVFSTSRKTYLSGFLCMREERIERSTYTIVTSHHDHLPILGMNVSVTARSDIGI